MIFLIIYYWIDLRRPFLGVVTIFPVIAIVMGTYLGMNLLEIPLNPVTATLTGIAIGIGVPFVIHVTNRFREALNKDFESCFSNYNNIEDNRWVFIWICFYHYGWVWNFNNFNIEAVSTNGPSCFSINWLCLSSFNFNSSYITCIVGKLS